jgi:cation diffusion facilitator CzcD-associated flavoprotein CzcO
MARRRFRVVVAGAGVSGLFMAETLKRARIDFTVYEKAGDVGGTWRDNTFPGLFVDVLSRNTSSRSSPTTTGRANMRRPPRSGPISRKSHATAVSPNSFASTRRSSRRGSPTVAGTSRPPRATRMMRTFSSAPPALHKPLLPDIAGRESFAGPAFHSARWDHDVPGCSRR